MITLVLDMNDDLTKMDLEIQRGRGFRGSGLSFSQCKVCCFFYISILVAYLQEVCWMPSFDACIMFLWWKSNRLILVQSLQMLGMLSCIWFIRQFFAVSVISIDCFSSYPCSRYPWDFIQYGRHVMKLYVIGRKLH